MSIHFECPGCREVSVLKDRMAGKRFACPECGRESTVRVDSDLDDDELLREAGAGRRNRFLAIAGFFVLTVLGVCAVVGVGAAHFDRSKQAPPAEPVVVETKGKEDEWIKRATEAFSRGDNDLAISCSTEAIQINPKAVEAYRLRAKAYQARKEYKLALTDYTEVIKFNPKDGLAYLGRAMVYAATGDIPRTEESCKMAEKLGVPPAQASVKLAAIFHEQGIEYLRKCIEFKSKTGALLSELTELNIFLTDKTGTGAIQTDLLTLPAEELDKKADTCFRAAQRLNPNDPTVYEHMALLDLTANRPDAAIETVTMALKGKLQGALLYFYRGAAFSQKGNAKQAELDYRQAVKMNAGLAAQKQQFYK